MIRFLLSLFKLVLGLCLIAFVAAFIAGSKAPGFISDKLSKKLKVPVKIEDMHFSLNQLEVDQLDIANIPNSYLSKAFSADKIICKNELFNYFEDQISIDEIIVSDIYLGLEFDSPKGTQGNWTVLMKNLDSSSEKVSTKNSKSVEIKQITFRNIQVDVVYKSAGNNVKKLPMIKEIVLKNINTSEGLPSDQIMQSVLGQMLKSVFVQENVKDMFEEILDQPQNALDTLIQPFKGLF